MAAGTVVERAATEAPGHYLDGIRTGRHDGYDRVVLDLTGAGVSYRVEYVDEALSSGSGLPIAMDGDAVLAITLIGMAHDDAGHYDWVARQPFDGQVVTETYRDGGGFEGRLTVFVGVEGEHPFRVLQLTGPDRVVVDVAVASSLRG